MSENRKIAEEVFEAVGGKENIQSADCFAINNAIYTCTIKFIKFVVFG